MFASRGSFAKSVNLRELQTEIELESLSISPEVRNYIGVLNRSQSGSADGEPKVEVNESVGVLAFAYEKLRNSVEYREEHVLLRSAIKRILKRRLNPLWQYESIASALLRELIWARYLKNESVPQSKEAVIEEKLRKYNVLRRAATKFEQAEDWQDWIIGIAACDIEQVLVDRKAGNALAQVMYESIRRHVVIHGLPEDHRDIQLYLSVHRTLLKSDLTLMSYHLFLLNAAGWNEASVDEAVEFVDMLSELRQRIDEQLHYDKGHEIARIVKRHAPPFVILDDVARENPQLAVGLLSRPAQLKRKVEEACQERYDSLRQRVVRAIVRSMIYILITKMVVALLLEVPFDRYVYGEIHWLQIGFNVGFPPLFMAVLGLSIKTPGERNTEVIFNRLVGIISGEERKEEYSLGKKRRAVLSPVLSFVYLVSSLGMFGLVAWLLWRAGFTPVGIGLFLFFFGVVVFFAYRVRQIAQELSVVREKENFFEGLLTLVTLPFLRLGHRLSSEFGKLNVFAFILDVLLEAPFKFILDITEHWINFIRQKREEMVESQEY